MALQRIFKSVKNYWILSSGLTRGLKSEGKEAPKHVRQ